MCGGFKWELSLQRKQHVLHDSVLTNPSILCFHLETDICLYSVGLPLLFFHVFRATHRRKQHASHLYPANWTVSLCDLSKVMVVNALSAFTSLFLLVYYTEWPDPHRQLIWLSLGPCFHNNNSHQIKMAWVWYFFNHRRSAIYSASSGLLHVDAEVEVVRLYCGCLACRIMPFVDYQVSIFFIFKLFYSWTFTTFTMVDKTKQ